MISQDIKTISNVLMNNSRNKKKQQIHNEHLAYSGRVRSTSGNQNRRIAGFFAVNKNKDNAKVASSNI